VPPQRWRVSAAKKKPQHSKDAEHGVDRKLPNRVEARV
jgi:hypothetical protein